MGYKLLVCDLDNTLYDWVDYFVCAFYKMVDAAVPILECDREDLLDDLKHVHQSAGDSEHPFALLETKLVQQRFPDFGRQEMLEQLSPAFHAFNSARAQVLKSYPTVDATLQTLKDSGFVLVAHTESRFFAALGRLRRLGLAKYFDKIYCKEAALTPHPSGLSRGEWVGDFPLDRVVELSHHQSKPDPDVLLEICSNHGCRPDQAIFIGDSMSKDMLMAKSAGVFAVWARYGTSHSNGAYEKLVRVTHWTDADVQRELEFRAKAREVRPDCVLNETFSEVLGCLRVTL